MEKVIHVVAIDHAVSTPHIQQRLGPILRTCDALTWARPGPIQPVLSPGLRRG